MLTGRSMSACSFSGDSGTTGHPKGVMYSHRSTLLHTYCICARDVLAICANDSILAIVPFFHANAWSAIRRDALQLDHRSGTAPGNCMARHR
jgi:fatty-acyl-CoA synthase